MSTKIIVSLIGIILIASVHTAEAERTQILAGIQAQLNVAHARALILRDAVIRLAIKELEIQVAELRAKLAILLGVSDIIDPGDSGDGEDLFSFPSTPSAPPTGTLITPEFLENIPFSIPLSPFSESDDETVAPLDSNDIIFGPTQEGELGGTLFLPETAPIPGSLEEAQAIFNPENVVLPQTVIATPTQTSVTITWTTDAPATSAVYYFLGSDIDNSENPDNVEALGQIAHQSLTQSHSVTITNLEPNTIYYYLIASIDGFGTFISQGNLTFQTLP